MEGIEFENSLLVLTHASLLKRKIPELLVKDNPSPPSGETTSPPSTPNPEDSEISASGRFSKRKRTRNTSKLPSSSASDPNSDSPTSKSARGTEKRTPIAMSSPKNSGEQSSGSEEDLSPVQSISPSALVAKLDPNLPLSSTLDRSILLTMSSRDFELFFNQLSAERTLTRSEEKMLKAQRRLISNRESAQASRRRKKAYIEELEGRVSEMHVKLSQTNASNAALSAQITELSSENAVLKSKLEEILQNERIFKEK
jgi:hypothetical protein